MEKFWVPFKLYGAGIPHKRAAKRSFKRDLDASVTKQLFKVSSRDFSEDQYFVVK